MIAETKIDASFTTAQFLLDNYHQPFRLDINCKWGGILVYVKSSVTSRKLKCDVLLKSIQAIPFELNLRKEKWLVISIYRPPSQDSEFFLNSLTVILDHFTKAYDNYLIMGDFNPFRTRRFYLVQKLSFLQILLPLGCKTTCRCPHVNTTSSFQ